MNCPSCQAENDSSALACTHCGATLVAPTSVVVTVDFSPGAVFHGRYEVMGLLGRGGMGMVYKARDKTLDEVVAIKILRPDFAQDPKMAERFKGEIKLARKVRHRNVCAIHDFGEERGLLYISMELIEGVDMKHVLKERGGLPPEEAYDVAIQVSEGLQAVHDAGIIHRDLKTPNIMRDAQGVARLMDFGIAKRQGSEGTMTATGQVVGTPEYMSPEQAQGRKLDFRSDIYALGIVTYEIFTGHVPFRGETPISTILKHLHDPPPLEGPPAARIPPSLKPVLQRALAKEPADRYSDAREFAEALRRARSPSLRQQPMPTVMLEAPTVKHVSASRHGLKPWLLVIPVAAVAGVVVLMQQRGGAPPPVSTAAPASTAPAPSVTAAAVLTLPPTLAATPAATAPPETAASARATPPPTRPTAPPSPRLARATGEPTPASQTTPVAVMPATTPTQVAPPPSTAAVGAGLLQVAVRPWGEVSVDGAVVGTTPLDKIPLSAGAHTVRVRHPAYELVERRISIQAGQTERVVVDFPVDGVRKP